MLLEVEYTALIQSIF